MVKSQNLFVQAGDRQRSSKQTAALDLSCVVCTFGAYWNKCRSRHVHLSLLLKDKSPVVVVVYWKMLWCFPWQLPGPTGNSDVFPVHDAFAFSVCLTRTHTNEKTRMQEILMAFVSRVSPPNVYINPWIVCVHITCLVSFLRSPFSPRTSISPSDVTPARPLTTSPQHRSSLSRWHQEPSLLAGLKSEGWEQTPELTEEQ